MFMLGNRHGLPKRSFTFAKMGKRSKKIMKYSAHPGAISKLSPARKLRAVFRNHNMFDEYGWYLHAVTNQGASATFYTS
jgi:hypothetical protein